MQPTATLKELAHRAGDGVEVSLYWSPCHREPHGPGRRRKGEERFELKARPDNALEVFYHPYAYAPLPAGAQAAPSAAFAGDCS